VVVKLSGIQTNSNKKPNYKLLLDECTTMAVNGQIKESFHRKSESHIIIDAR
jgi:hypothetical protein